LNSKRDGQVREVYLEFLTVGESIKVTAIDSVTGREVSIVGPARAPQKELERVAIDKLQYVLGRTSSHQGKSDEERSSGDDDGKGWVV